MKKSKNKHKDKNNLPFASHIRELMIRVLLWAIVWLVAFVVLYLHATELLGIIRTTAEQMGFVLIALAPQDVLLQELKIAAMMAFVGTLPLGIFNISAFVFPIFDKKGKKAAIVVAEIFAMALFGVGAFFAYEVLLPLILSFLAGISVDASIATQVSLKEFVGLYLTIITCLGIVFEMPLIVIVLTRMGIATPVRMKGAFRYVIVVSFIIAAIITPPDVISQVLVALPMCILYGISIGLSALFMPRKKNED